MSSDESDSDGDNFVRDKNALAQVLREKKLFRLSLEVGPRIPPQVPHGTLERIGWRPCEKWQTNEINSCTYQVRMDRTYNPNLLGGPDGYGMQTINPDCPTNPEPSPPLELEIRGDVPSKAWHFHWQRSYSIGVPPQRRGTPKACPHCPVCPARTIIGWQATMNHLRTVNMNRYPMAGNRVDDETAIGDEVSELHDDPVVFHHALRQAILIERDAFWHCFNRRKVAEVSLWALRQACERLGVTIDHDNLVRIVLEAEKLNRAAAESFRLAGNRNAR